MQQRTDARRRKEARRKQRRRLEKVAWLNALKLKSGCVDCGYNQNPRALDFDHVQGNKVNAVSQLIPKTWPVLMAEVAKCEVRCANCHRIRTAERFEQAMGQGVLELG